MCCEIYFKINHLYNKVAKIKPSREVKVSCKLKVDWNNFRMLFVITKIASRTDII